VKIRRAAALASLALLPFAGAAHAQNAPNQAGDSNTDLRAEIEEQKQRLAILERKLELQQEAATAAAASAPKITANATRFQIGSPDNSNFIRFRSGGAVGVGQHNIVGLDSSQRVKISSFYYVGPLLI